MANEAQTSQVHERKPAEATVYSSGAFVGLAVKTWPKLRIPNLFEKPK